ncbi:uncharacterized protein LOC105183683 [Harpegnathos saltator]|uniref:uncharacterized protein LOC105183683 n=1 Tax=Harpegnathos saltator TaxID=610380 RepID=UPI00058C01B5|nr:uncharacterized protein LOC105183683 [Harpegnathos saltator]
MLERLMNFNTIQAAITCSSQTNFSEQYISSSLKSKKFESKKTSSNRIVSEIVRKSQPYKEIEATFNDNHVIIRMHKEPNQEEYNPPCECVGQTATTKISMSSLKKCDDGVSFEMNNGDLELCRIPQEDASSADKSLSEKEMSCRTIKLYPEADKDIKAKVENSTERNDNPNIFILRIKKWCDSGDKKHKVDFEFRAPRPWQSQKN